MTFAHFSDEHSLLPPNTHKSTEETIAVWLYFLISSIFIVTIRFNHIINASRRVNLQAHKFNTDPFVRMCHSFFRIPCGAHSVALLAENLLLSFSFNFLECSTFIVLFDMRAFHSRLFFQNIAAAVVVVAVAANIIVVIVTIRSSLESLRQRPYQIGNIFDQTNLNHTASKARMLILTLLICKTH